MALLRTTTTIATITAENENSQRNQNHRPQTMVLKMLCGIVSNSLVGSHRGTPRRGSSASDSEASDFGLRPSKRRRIGKSAQKSKILDIIPAERTSSRVGAKVVNYNENDEDSVHEEDLMPNEFGEVWTYGMTVQHCRLLRGS